MVMILPNDTRLTRCGFAKLVGSPGVDYVIRKYSVTLGRRSKATDLDVVLGDMMSVSRQHARIYYNFETSADRRLPALQRPGRARECAGALKLWPV